MTYADLFYSTGGQIGHLPIICTSGSATFKAALRVRIQAGTTVEIFGTGFDFELGVYADLIEYVATIGTSDTCELFITESVDVNIGAFAHAVVELDYKTFGASPAVVTTLLDYPLPSLCLIHQVESSLPVFPTSTAIPITSPIAASSGSYPTATAAASTTSPGAIFFQGSSSYVASSSPTLSGSVPTASAASGSYTASGSGAAASSGASPTVYGNGTVTSAASMTTSTIYTTDLITITSCSSTVLHCPASLTSKMVITSTAILYTTVCPVGQEQPTFTPTASSTTESHPINTASIIVSPVPLTPCATPVVSTIYTPTFVNPTYTMPTATSFTVPNPNFSNSYTTSQAAPTSSSGNGGIVSTITVAPVYSPSLALINSVPSANRTVLATGSAKAQPTGPATFTGGATKSFGSIASGVAVAIGVSMFLLL
jgi:hypothetical protein